MTDLRALPFVGTAASRWEGEMRCRAKHQYCPHRRQHLLRRRPRQAKGRWDIQGLRAFAVVAVILDHLLHWPNGGFVGVDIFFVISGFLITGILLREHEKTGHISFVGFYRRRIKRIIPASILVLVVTVLASAFVFGGTRARDTLVDAVWAALFAGNWRFAAESTNYFEAGGPISPIQHYWSLSVEEQFYFVWPWLMLAIFALLIRNRMRLTRARVYVGLALLMVTVGSFIWAIHETATNPNQAYFSTFSRTWELGIGALLAVTAPLAHKIPDAVRPALAWVGFATMLASLWIVSPEVSFPAPWAALPVLATTLVIAAGTFPDHLDQQRFLFPLTNRASGYIGDISYSLYLWHFPVTILGTAALGEGNVTLALLAAVMLVISVYSYHLVEDPIRRSTWLEPDARRLRRVTPSAWSGRRDLAFSGLVLCAAVVCAVALRPAESVGGLDAVEQRQVEKEAAAQFTPAVADLQVQIRAALAAEAWPRTLNLTMDAAIEEPEAPADIMPCGQRGTLDTVACTWGSTSPKRRAVIVGDSVSMTYVSVLRQALPKDWALTSAGTFGCAFTSTLISNPDAAITAACEDRKAQAVAAIQRIRPDVLFVTNTYEPRVPVGSTDPLTSDQWADSSTKMLKRIRGAVGRIVLLSPPPSDVNLSECYSRVSSPSNCISSVTPQWQNQAAAERRMAASLGGLFVDSRDWFCADGLCPPFVGKTPMKSDQVHITPDYQDLIVPAVAERLARLGVITRRGAA